MDNGVIQYKVDGYLQNDRFVNEKIKNREDMKLFFKISTYYRLSSNDEKGAENFIINELSNIQQSGSDSTKTHRLIKLMIVQHSKGNYCHNKRMLVLIIA